MAFTFVTVTRTYGPGATGTVSFALDRLMSNGGDAAGLGAAWLATLDGSGNISISLPSTLDPNNRTPSGTTDARMRVHERVNGGNHIYYVPIPTSGPVNLASLATADDSTTVPTLAGLVLPLPLPGQYLWATSPNGSATSNTLGNGTLRLAPWVITRTTAIDRIGAEITTVGEAGSKLRLGIYADSGFATPGVPLLDAGQIAGDSATVQELTCSLVLSPGVYWTGGAVQSAPTTAPTVRVTSSWTPGVPMGVGVSIPGANSLISGYSTSATGALPSPFPASPSGAGQAPRIFVRLA